MVIPRIRPGWLLCLLAAWAFSGHVGAAIINNNNVFQISEQMQIKAQRLIAAQNKSADESDAPVFQDKLPNQVYAKALDAYAQIRQLMTLNNLPPIEDKQLPFQIFRPKDVYDLLEQADQGLNAILEAKSISTEAEFERPLGKSGADVYQSLWKLTNVLSVLAPPPDIGDTQKQFKLIEDELKLLARAQNLKFTEPQKNQYSDKSVRDVMLALYQDYHLLGRLQRNLEVEPTSPEAIPSGALTVLDAYDGARSVLAEIHRMKAGLNIEQRSPAPSGEANASLNSLYAQAKKIHDLLISLLSGMTPAGQ
ncbi:hypothetical protein [Hahella sp. HN01]|uniref:hypothetical protein n=1 Tax=Hahella sp. HN01 TaxID=2847262 RepID=UPI001C1F07C5|nr:hypothetical protein [Hahella sp. HN01]MBU6952395.1 hypothetical protein [Hahella sp. HN01]